MEIEILKDNIFNIFSERKNSLLDRYGFLKNNWRKTNFKKTKKGNTLLIETGKFTLNFKDGKITSLICRDKNGKCLFKGKFYIKQEQYIAEFDIDKNEKFVGLGDQTRERIEHRGTFVKMWVKNVDSYIPIPFLMSSKNYGIFVNTTYKHYWNIGKSNPDKLYIILPEGNFNIYIFGGNSFYELLSSYTDLTGKPCFPPKWSFGLWFICRSSANDFEVISDALNFRDRKIPCDIIGLEPGWMEKYYDYSIEKNWHPERFPIPPYAPNGPHTFISALKRMGFKIELWLCNDYDLIYEEERKIGNDFTEKEKKNILFSEDNKEKDLHLTQPVKMDKITKIEQPWFEHLKKFIDQGIDFFKQDGALQVSEHPDRLWGGFLTDKEVHNLYPLLYSRQMYEGIKNYTGKRPCCFTPAGWAGLQKYTGTWTGDTGGEAKTLVACLNLAFSGHSLVTCDMEVTTKEGIHYGFLLPWAQVNSWNYFRHPWLLGNELFPVFLDYARLRYQLIPYIYTYAYNSHKTGIPIIRPLPLEFPEDENTYNILNEYFLGKELLVTTFKKEVYLPDGKYLDLWKEKVYTGKKKLTYTPPKNRGGGLFLRENSILPLGPVIQYTEEKTDKGYTVLIFISKGEKAEFSLYDDDGISFNYQKGDFQIYKFNAEYKGENLTIYLPEKLKIENVIVYSAEKIKNIIQKGNKTSNLIFKQV